MPSLQTCHMSEPSVLDQSSFALDQSERAQVMLGLIRTRARVRA